MLNILKDHHNIKMDLESFMNPTKRFAHPPSLLKGVQEAGEMIMKHRESVVAIHTDIDCDGVMALGVAYSFLTPIISGELHYVHSQRSMGHGIKDSMNRIKKLNPDLLIILDASSNEFDEIAQLNELGIDVIVLDHHICLENPLSTEKFIRVNPMQDECSYPNKDISAAGVVLKLIEYMSMKYEEVSKNARDYYDLVAISILADQRNMLDMENRYYVSKGIQNIRNSGLRALLDINNSRKYSVSSTDVLYKIAPAINSACRLDKIEKAIELVLNKGDSEELAQEIVELNSQRVSWQREYSEDVMAQSKDVKNLVYAVVTIPSGFRGLVAGDIASRLGKPTIIFSKTGDDNYTFSYRSPSDDLYELIFNQYGVSDGGGHPQAGGGRLKDWNEVCSLIEYLKESVCNKKVKVAIPVINSSNVTLSLVETIDQFYRVSGNNFSPTKFAISNIFVETQQTIGEHKNTVRLTCKTSGNRKIDALAFRVNPNKFPNLQGNYGEIIGELSVNEFRGHRKPQIIFSDFQHVF